MIDNNEEIAYTQDQLDNVAIDYALRRAPPPPAIPKDREPHQEVEMPPMPLLEPEPAPTAAPAEPPQ